MTLKIAYFVLILTCGAAGAVSAQGVSEPDSVAGAAEGVCGVEEAKKTVLTVKSNLLYDAITALNVAVEVPIGEKWSVELEDVCPWWHHENKWAFQLLQVGAEGRYWFKPSRARKVLTGQFGGLYVMGGKYDLQKRRDICYQGEFWSVGASYGYAMPIGKRFNMEFSVSLGFMSTHYKHYNPSENWNDLVADKRKHGRFTYWGPTKVKVSLIYPIDVKVKKKGGRHD